MKMLSSNVLSQGQAPGQMGLGAMSASASSAPSTHRDGQLPLSCAQGLVDRAVDDSLRDDLDVAGHLADLDLVLMALQPQAVLLFLWERRGVLTQVHG